MTTDRLRPRDYSLLVIPVISGILAVESDIFLFKAGVAASCIVILCLFFNKALIQHKDIGWIISAFIFSIAGDWFLSNKSESVLMFAAGIGLFFVAHAGYLGYAVLNGRLNRSVTFVLLIAYLVFFATTLYPAMESPVLTAASLAYLLISCISLGAAAGMHMPALSKSFYISGIALILLSDTIISFHEFLHYRELSFLILPTYYLAQISITISVMQRKKSSLARI